MPNLALLKSWKITETYLESARRALPEPSEQHQSQYTELLAEYRHFLKHNELGLAFETLEAAGHLAPCRSGFWRDLELAAENMGLADKLPIIRKNFLAALK